MEPKKKSFIKFLPSQTCLAHFATKRKQNLTKQLLHTNESKSASTLKPKSPMTWRLFKVFLTGGVSLNGATVNIVKIIWWREVRIPVLDVVTDYTCFDNPHVCLAKLTLLSYTCIISSWGEKTQQRFNTNNKSSNGGSVYLPPIHTF